MKLIMRFVEACKLTFSRRASMEARRDMAEKIALNKIISELLALNSGRSDKPANEVGSSTLRQAVTELTSLIEAQPNAGRRVQRFCQDDGTAQYDDQLLTKAKVLVDTMSPTDRVKLLDILVYVDNHESVEDGLTYRPIVGLLSHVLVPMFIDDVRLRLASSVPGILSQAELSDLRLGNTVGGAIAKHCVPDDELLFTESRSLVAALSSSSRKVLCEGIIFSKQDMSTRPPLDQALLDAALALYIEDNFEALESSVREIVEQTRAADESGGSGQPPLSERLFWDIASTVSHWLANSGYAVPPDGDELLVCALVKMMLVPGDGIDTAENQPDLLRLLPTETLRHFRASIDTTVVDQSGEAYDRQQAIDQAIDRVIAQRDLDRQQAIHAALDRMAAQQERPESGALAWVGSLAGNLRRQFSRSGN